MTELPFCFKIIVRSSLIHDQDGGILQNSTRHCQFFPLPARKIARVKPDGLIEISMKTFLKELLHPAFHKYIPDFVVTAPSPGIQIVSHAVLKKAGFLIHNGKPIIIAFFRTGKDIAAVHPDFS